jgi:hypothetical protein
MIDAIVGTSGIQFQASEEASAFVEALRTDYARALKERAVWLADYLSRTTDVDLAQLIAERIGRWAVEFQGEVGHTSSL